MVDAILVSESSVTWNDSNPIQLAEHFPLGCGVYNLERNHVERVSG